MVQARGQPVHVPRAGHQRRRLRQGRRGTCHCVMLGYYHIVISCCAFFSLAPLVFLFYSTLTAAGRSHTALGAPAGELRRAASFFHE